MRPQDQLAADLGYVFGWFPLPALEHLRGNGRRLVRQEFRAGDKGCLFYLLTEVLPNEYRIADRKALTRFFTGSSGHPWCEMPEYQPARWLVRLFDGCDVRERYGEITHLSWEMIVKHLDRAIAQRRSCEAEAARVQLRVLAACARQPHRRFRTVTPINRVQTVTRVRELDIGRR